MTEQDNSKNIMKILFVVDDKNWAFAISAREMLPYLPGYDVTIIDYEQTRDKDAWKGYDVVYLFAHYMIDWLPDNFEGKICAGIRAEFGFLDDDREGDQDLTHHEKAQHLLQIQNLHVVNDRLLKWVGEFHPNVIYACHGVDCNFFKPDSKNDGIFTIGWAGNRSNPVKNINLVEQVVAKRTDCVVKTAEFGKKQLNRKDMLKFYQSIDCYILPSKSEGLSATMLEALACGVPIISTDNGDWREILKRSKCGMTIKANVDSIEDAINRMIKLGKAERRKMGERARDEALENWDWSIRIEDFKTLFNNTMNQTTETFNTKWETIPNNYGSSSEEQVNFFQDWAIRKYGFETRQELNDFYKSKKNILEVGFGSAFNMNYISEQTTAKITGVDTSERACSDARKLLGSNAEIINEDLMKFQGAGYDLIIADGVLHHLENPHAAIKRLYGKLTKGGHMYIYLYRQMGPIREFTNDYIRDELQKLPPHRAIKRCEGLTNLGKQLSKIKGKIKVEDVIGFQDGEYTVHELVYYNMLKCFWNDCFDFDTNNMNQFDWFYPKFAFRYQESEVRRWLDKMGCKYKINNSNPNGISVLIERV